MWLFTTVGFFSVVRDNKADGQGLLVRARVREDLEQLREKYLPELGKTTHDSTRDYPYRAKCSHDAFAQAAARIALEIDYSNFKGEVARKQGWDREKLYSQVWSVMLGAERKLEKGRRSDTLFGSPHAGRSLPMRPSDLLMDTDGGDLFVASRRDVISPKDMDGLSVVLDADLAEAARKAARKKPKAKRKK